MEEYIASNTGWRGVTQGGFSAMNYVDQAKILKKSLDNENACIRVKVVGNSGVGELANTRSLSRTVLNGIQERFVLQTSRCFRALSGWLPPDFFVRSLGSGAKRASHLPGQSILGSQLG